MKFYIFSSGSQGNATLVVDKNVHILIDLGISKKKICEELNKLNLSFNDIDFILLTHEHIDHIKSIDSISTITIYGGKDTYKGSQYKSLNPYTSFRYQQLNIIPLEVSHDANNPLGFIVSNADEKLVYITDTGFLNERNMKLAKNATYYIFESNHDRHMLLNTNRPMYVKERIMSEFGHLSNEDSALYLSEMVGDKTREIYLAHISLEANTYDLAKQTCIDTLKRKRIDLNHIKIDTAKQFETVEGGHEN